VHNVRWLGCFWSTLNFSRFFAIPRQTALHGWSTGVFRVGRSSLQRAAPAFDVVWRMSALDALAFLLLLLFLPFLLLPSRSASPFLCSFLSYPRFVLAFSLPLVHSTILPSRFIPLSRTRENPVWRTRLSLPSGAPTENWKHPIGPRYRCGHDKKIRAAAPRWNRKICRSVVDPRGTVTRSGSMRFADP